MSTNKLLLYIVRFQKVADKAGMKNKKRFPRRYLSGQIEHKPVSRLFIPEYDFIDDILFYNRPGLRFGIPEQLSQDRRITRVLKFGIEWLMMKLKKDLWMECRFVLVDCFVPSVSGVKIPKFNR